MKTENYELFDGDDSTAKFWRRLRTTAKKTEIMSELIDLRTLQITGKLPDADCSYLKKLIKAVSAEFAFCDAKIRAQRVMGERREAKKNANTRRKILIGAFVEKSLQEEDQTGKPEFLRQWLAEGLDEYLTKLEDRKLFNDLILDFI